MPVIVSSPTYERALCGWFYSTAGLIQNLNKRGRKLTYSLWELSLWRAIKIPYPNHPEIGLLAEAFHRTRDQKDARFDQMMECRVRPVLDKAAAAVLETSTERVALWRRLLAQEPSISNKLMPLPVKKRK